MTLVEISHNEFELACQTLTLPSRTGRVRWWKPIVGATELQCEWKSDLGFTQWITVPTVTELK